MIMLVLSGCGKSSTVPWLPEDLKKEHPLNLTADFLQTDLLYVNYRTTTGRYIYRRETGEVERPSSDALKNIPLPSGYETELTLEMVPMVLDGVTAWVDCNQPELLQEGISCSYLAPKQAYGSQKEDGRNMIYSFSRSTLTVLSGEYHGSTAYGAITLFTHDGVWQILLDE